jgi:cytochrome c
VRHNAKSASLANESGLPDAGCQGEKFIMIVFARKSILSGLLIMLLFAPVSAETAKPTQDEVAALTLKAAGIIESQGTEAARELFNKDGEFKYGEIYVNLIDFAGTWLIYPPRPAGVGQSVINVKDADGKFLVQDIIKLAKDKGEGWVEYRWLNPVSNKIEPKVSFVKRIPGKELVTYVGIYK